jgi:hypothetical protein
MRERPMDIHSLLPIGGRRDFHKDDLQRQKCFYPTTIRSCPFMGGGRRDPTFSYRTYIFAVPWTAILSHRRQARFQPTATEAHVFLSRGQPFSLNM